MTPYLCAECLVNDLRGLFKDYVSPCEKTAANGIKIYTGYLPKYTNSADKQKNSPCIAVRPVQIDDEEAGRSYVTLQVLVQTYDDNLTEGHREMYHILQMIREYILTNEVINQQYDLQQPAHTMIPEEQPWPLWWGYMVLRYDCYQPHENLINFLNQRGF